MKDWALVITYDGLTHVMERVAENKLVSYCSQTLLSEVEILENPAPLTCMTCAAWWTSEFGGP